jgi:hypothetical protein
VTLGEEVASSRKEVATCKAEVATYGREIATPSIVIASTPSERPTIRELMRRNAVTVSRGGAEIGDVRRDVPLSAPRLRASA